MTSAPPDRHYLSLGPDDTRRVGAAVVRSLGGRGVVGLYGDLGLGKTCLVQGMAGELEVAAPVTSPTYTLVHEYRGRRPLIHVDLYRVRNAAEALGFGLDEYLADDAITVIEWAERVDTLLPPDALRVRFRPGWGPSVRLLSVAGGAAR